MVWRERRHLLPFRPNDDGLEVRLRKVTARATESHTTTIAVDLAWASVRECPPTAARAMTLPRSPPLSSVACARASNLLPRETGRTLQNRSRVRPSPTCRD